MKKVLMIVGIVIMFSTNTIAYVPDDPDFMCAEPGTEYYEPGTWIFDEQFAYFSFAPFSTRLSAIYRDPGRYGTPQISGSSIDLAWDIGKGDSATVIAIVDTGVVWGDLDIVEKLFINMGELPLPEGSTLYDANQDGVFNVMDYSEDQRVVDVNLNGLLDPQDLIAAFSDSFDDDGNGFTDDICGWDFFENDNDPEDISSYFAARYHGRGQSRRAAGQQDNGIGGCGVCPECLILPLKNWDSFIVDTNYFGLATIYANMMGASVLEGAIGGMNNSGICKEAFRDAYDSGMALFLVSSDVNSANHNFPTYLDEPIYCSGMVTDTYPIPYVLPTTYFRDSNLTQYGTKNQLSFEVATGSESTAMSSGAGAMLFSQARKMGIELYPDQVKQLLTMTAEDVLPENLGSIGSPDPAQEGWDQHFGYGRVNLFAAMERLDLGDVPPVARITSPAWSTYLDPTRDVLSITGDIMPYDGQEMIWVLEAGYGIEPTNFHVLTSGTSTGFGLELIEMELSGIMSCVFPNDGDFDFSSYPAQPDPKNPGEADIQPNRHMFTVRLRVEDPSGVTLADDRRSFFLYREKNLHDGWPVNIGVGGEASPRFADLDGDNLLEIIIATADGRILIFKHNGEAFSVNDKPIVFYSEPHALAQNHGMSLPGIELRSTFITPAIGDIDGDSIKEIVSVAGNKVYCFKADGRQQFSPIDFSDNFFQDIKENRLCEDNHIGPGTMAAPVLHDLDGDGAMEIIVAAADERIYAWHCNGTPVEGWPVYVRSADTGARIIHPPCLADLDGDGTKEIVVATNEYTASKEQADDQLVLAASKSSALDKVPGALLPFALNFVNSLVGKDCFVYAIYPDGTMHDGDPDGEGGRNVDEEAFVEGWPVAVKSLMPDTLPLIGPSNKPCSFDYDNDGADEVVASFVAAQTTIIDGSGSILKKMDQGPMGDHALGIRDTSLALNMFDSAAIGDITGDHKPEIAKGGITLMGALNLALAGQNLPFNHIVQVWDTQSGKFLDAYPRTIDDFTMYSEPCIADMSGDRVPDVVACTGLYLVHAFGADGMDARGFPKLCGGWVMTTPAAGDIDNDGFNELAVVTREGWIFIWDTQGRTTYSPDWPTYGHDNFTSSNSSVDAVPPASVTDMHWTGDNEIEFTCPGDDGFNGRARRIQIYGSTSPINVYSIRDAVLIEEVPPGMGGFAMQVEIANEHAHYAIIAYDEAGNASQLVISTPDISPEEEPETSKPKHSSGNGICFIGVGTNIP